MRSAALAVRFLLELAALAALVYAGVAVLGGVWGWLLGVAAAGLAALVWGLFVAPRAHVIAPTTIRLGIEFAIIIAACLGLLLAQRPVLALTLIGLHLVDRLALWLSGAPIFEPDPGPPSTRRLRS